MWIFLPLGPTTASLGMYPRMHSFATGVSGGAGSTHHLSFYRGLSRRSSGTRRRLRYWFPSLLELLMDYPRQLPHIPHLITLPSQPEKEHPLQHSLRLTVWPVSGSVTAQTGFRRRLRRFYCHPGVTLHGNATLGHGTLGQAGVLHGFSVPLQPL